MKRHVPAPLGALKLKEAALLSMNKRTAQSAFFNLRVLIGLVIALTGVILALQGFRTFAVPAASITQAQQSYTTTNSIDPRVRLVDTTGGKLEYAGASISIPENALKKATTIRIDRMAENGLPPLDPGMINVTAGGGGYRFLPHGTNFGKEVTIQIPLDGTAFTDSESGSTSGVRTYFWDEKYRQWIPLKRVHGHD